MSLTLCPGLGNLNTLILREIIPRTYILQMDNTAEYWRRAQAAYEHARQTTNEKDRATWLQIAESFATLHRLAGKEQEAVAEECSDPPGDLLH